jgi:hypothetical protein
MIVIRPIEGSSQIAGIGYDQSIKILRVQFKSKKGPSEYDYHGVEPEVHEAFMNAPSKGKFLHSQIKPNFICKKVVQDL